MEANYWCFENYTKSKDGGVCLTSVGEKSDCDEGF